MMQQVAHGSKSKAIRMHIITVFGYALSLAHHGPWAQHGKILWFSTKVGLASCSRLLGWRNLQLTQAHLEIR